MTVVQRIKTICSKYPKSAVLQIKDRTGKFQPFLYEDFYREISTAGSALCSMGVKKESHVAIISDNRKEWIVTDLAVMGIGAVDVPRGSDSTEKEIVHILSHSESMFVFVENFKEAEIIAGHKAEMPLLEAAVIFNDISDGELEKLNRDLKFIRYSAFIERGKKLLEEEPDFFEKKLAEGKESDLATIIYTSGTTGTPKGVMLTHESFIFQIDRIKADYLTVLPGHTLLSMLPIWHAFERTVEYIVLFSGGNIAYSKPIGTVLLDDIRKTRAQWMTSVPRIWDSIKNAVIRAMNKSGKYKKVIFFIFLEIGVMYRKVVSCLTGTVPRFYKRNRIADFASAIFPIIVLFPLNLLGNLIVFRKFKKILGGRFIAGISGGGSLSSHTQGFFNGIGIKILEGYGLTETGPILSVCRQKRPVYGTVGPIFKDTMFKVVGKNNEILPPGSRGVLWVKSPQVMKGYFKQEEETAKVISDGWFDTGDIVVATFDREIKIVGRNKETIVLLGGENIEPVPIENACMQSDYIDQIVVLGQDRKFISALVVPNYKLIQEKAEEMRIAYMDIDDLLSSSQIYNLIYSEISEIVSKKNGFKNYEKIFRIKLLPKPFTVGDELTNSLKVKRDVIKKKYRSEIAKLFK